MNTQTTNVMIGSEAINDNQLIHSVSGNKTDTEAQKLPKAPNKNETAKNISNKAGADSLSIQPPSQAGAKRIITEDLSDMNKRLNQNYVAVSKNGDTLELSNAGKRQEIHKYSQSPELSAKVVSTSGKRIADSVLAGYSEAKLKQLYAQKAISKQQYNHAIQKRKGN